MGRNILTLLIIALFTQAQGKISNESEVATAIVSGNTNTETYSGRSITAYDWDEDGLRASGRYLRTLTSGQESALSWDASLRYERRFTDVFGGFLAHGAESDVYSNVVQRDFSDIGARYFLLNDEESRVLAEAGYRYTWTNYVRPVTHPVAHLGRAYLEARKKIQKQLTGKLWIEYLPNFTDNEAYLTNGEASIALTLNDYLSVKTSYLIKYQNKLSSQLTKHTDTIFLTALVAQF